MSGDDDLHYLLTLIILEKVMTPAHTLKSKTVMFQQCPQVFEANGPGIIADFTEELFTL